MKIDGSAVHYLLVQEFGDVIYDMPTRSVAVDYPVLYDSSADMSGHAILVPNHERPNASPNMRNVLCVCMGDDSMESAHDAGLAAIGVRGGVTFPHLYNYMQAMFVNFERLDARLRTYVDSYAGFQALLDACCQAMNCSIALVDEHYQCVYQASAELGEQPDGIAELLDEDDVDLFMASHDYRHMRQSRNVFTTSGMSDLLMKNVFSHGKLVGMLVTKHNGEVLNARYVRFALRYLTPFVEEMHERLGSFETSASDNDRVRAAVTNALAGGGAEVASLEAILEEGGHGAHANYVVSYVERSFTNDSVEEREYLFRRFESALPGTCCFIVDNGLYVLADIDFGTAGDRDSFWRQVPILARENLSKTGISRVFRSMEHLDAARHQAAAALMCGKRRDPMKWCYRFEGYAVPWIVDRVRGDEPVESFRHPAIGMLERYDKEHGSSLSETLACFLRCRFNATAAAEELFVARSTLLNRLERIKELTGIDLEDADELLYLGVSFKM